ncbi:MAG: MBL fold metallo-hydrolase [Promethearchaeota archaeon]
MTTITITLYGGTDGIGGNKILLETGDERFFLDHGQSFSYGEKYFAGWLGARERMGLKDHFALGLIPKIPGLYSADALEKTDFAYQVPAFDGIFISHVHYDHVAHLKYVDPELPVYLGVTTKNMLDSWQTTTNVNFKDHDYRTFKTGDKINVGSCEVEPVHVDHSTPAAYGFIVHTPAGAIVYTGDLRMHGPMAHMTRDFIDRAKAAEPVAMICEGTRVAPVETRRNMTEQDVLDGAIDAINGTEKLVIVSFYNRDVDRIKTYHAAARATGRKFVVSTRVAHLIESLVPDPGITVPDPFNDPNMLVYQRELKRINKWEKTLVQKNPAVIIDADYVHAHQDELILHLDFPYFNEIIDLRPDPGSIYINSLSEPFTEDDIEDAVKDNWLDHFQMQRFQLHASGHCSRDEIFSIVNEINPKVVYPIHTEYPALFKGNVSPKVVVPARGIKIKIP